MNTEIENVSETRRQATVVLTDEEYQQADNEVGKMFAGQAQLPGFRAGKAPEKMVRKRFAKKIAEQVEQKLLKQVWDELDGRDDFAIYDVLDADTSGLHDSSHKLLITFDIEPEFELPDLKGVEIEVPELGVSDEDVESTLQRLLRDRADYSVVEREARKGDFVKLDYEGRIGEESVADLVPESPIYGVQKGTWEEAGAEEGMAVKAVVEGVIGMKAGDSKTVEEVFADDFEVQKLAGKTVSYVLQVSEVREVTMPEIDEAFLKTLNVDSEEALRKTIRESMEGQQKQQRDNMQRGQVYQKLLGAVEFPVPEGRLASQTRNVLVNMMGRLMQQGRSQEELESDSDRLTQEASEVAREQLKMSLIASKAAKQEGIEVKSEDIQQAIINQAMETRTPPDDIVKQLKENQEMLARLRSNILVDKVLKHYSEQVTFKEVAAPEPESK